MIGLTISAMVMTSVSEVHVVPAGHVITGGGSPMFMLASHAWDNWKKDAMCHNYNILLIYFSIDIISIKKIPYCFRSTYSKTIFLRPCVPHTTNFI